jgi:hypothetical protein
MAINPANMTSIVSGGPAMGTAGGYAFGPGDVQEPAFVGQATFTGDGAAVTTTLNFIDGTNAIPFTPTGVRLSKIGGNDTNNGIPVYNSSTALNNISVGVVFTAAPASAKTVLILAELYK